ncbi:unnamed protein product [Darwinula stevensoni]|uniref:ELMO domain-containing protein n=1 Tax=Darwinula stevensoni TaxID=69355 RepID=A0A7R8XA09_9CRUS|nr:unnamed protein product [Darwinula stevensoni]CAG0885083.1 unnamed protein product [Darwinula stevensoni]
MGLGGPMPMPGGPRKAPGLGPTGPKGPKPGGAGEGLGPLNDGIPRPCCIGIGAEDGRGPGAFVASPSSVPISPGAEMYLQLGLAIVSFVLLITIYLRLRLHSVKKRLLRVTTKLCELQRICYETSAGAERSLRIEGCLRASKQPSLQRLVRELDRLAKEYKFGEHVIHLAVTAILNAKNISSDAHSPFVSGISQSVRQIWGYRQLFNRLDDIRQTQYDCNNTQHEAQLTNLWNALVPTESLPGRHGKHWSYIGFQGEDPASDFRGMGLLGLYNLQYLSHECGEEAQKLLLHSHHPSYGYSFAIMGINMTDLCLQLLRDGTARTHFFNENSSIPTEQDFHHFYACVFIQFDSFWIDSKPDSIMNFSDIRTRFEMQLRRQLQDPKAHLVLEHR